MSTTSRISTSTSVVNFFPGGADSRTTSSVHIHNDVNVRAINTVSGLTESEARLMVRRAKKAGFEVGQKTWWKRGWESKTVKRKTAADYYDQEIILRRGNTTVQYILFVDLN
jgi:hypothetical protein